MIGVIVPAHNEAGSIAACLRSIQAAAGCVALNGEEVLVIVVLDACTDDTERICRETGVVVLSCDVQNVGIARALGAATALEAGARWLAFTDADSVVAPDWISKQLALSSDVVCGTIAVDDWGVYGERMRCHFEATYTDADDHRHVHGANLGISAFAYVIAGGFPPLVTGEDVAIVSALLDVGASVAWSAAPRVVTSARTSFRAATGFGSTLARIEAERSWHGMPPASRSAEHEERLDS